MAEETLMASSDKEFELEIVVGNILIGLLEGIKAPTEKEEKPRNTIDYSIVLIYLFVS